MFQVEGPTVAMTLSRTVFNMFENQQEAKLTGVVYWA